MKGEERTGLQVVLSKHDDTPIPIRAVGTQWGETWGGAKPGTIGGVETVVEYDLVQAGGHGGVGVIINRDTIPGVPGPIRPPLGHGGGGDAAIFGMDGLIIKTGSIDTSFGDVKGDDDDDFLHGDGEGG